MGIFILRVFVSLCLFVVEHLGGLLYVTRFGKHWYEFQCEGWNIPNLENSRWDLLACHLESLHLGSAGNIP